MSHVFQHIMASLERDVVLRDLWKNSRTWHNRVTVVPWYNLLYHYKQYFPARKGEITIFTFHIPFSLCWVWECDCHLFLFHRSPARWLRLYYQYFLLSSCVSSSLSFLMSAEYQGARSAGIRQDSLGDEALNYCRRCHTKTALWCFSSLCVSVNVSVCHNL